MASRDTAEATTRARRKFRRRPHRQHAVASISPQSERNGQVYQCCQRCCYYFSHLHCYGPMVTSLLHGRTVTPRPNSKVHITAHNTFVQTGTVRAQILCAEPFRQVCDCPIVAADGDHGLMYLYATSCDISVHLAPTGGWVPDSSHGGGKDPPCN